MSNRSKRLDEIRAEAERFFEWPGDDRSIVTLTSCILFAEHIAAKSPVQSVPDVSAMARVLSNRIADVCNVDREDNWKIYGQGYIDDVKAMLAATPSAPAAQGWIPVGERLPEGTVLASYTNNYSKSRVIRAQYVQKFTQESEDIDDFDAQYDEATDTYYDPEGWYELIDNWPDYASCAVIEGVITHWMPLPKSPEVK